jgi:hypothetical protein
MSRRRGPRVHVGEHIGFSFKIGCLPITVIFLAILGLPMLLDACNR